MRAAWASEAEVERDPATALMYDAAELLYAEIGERHSYSGVVEGVAAVLREMGGIEVTRREMSDWHSDLVGLSDEMARGTLTFARVAKSMSEGFFGSWLKPASEIDYPFGQIVGGRYPHDIEMPHFSRRLQLEWITAEIAKQLKKEGIRRGTKRHGEFLSKHAGRVIEAVRETVEKAMAEAAGDATRALGKAEKLAEQANERLGVLRRAQDVREAALRVAGLEVAPAVAANQAAQIADWESAALKLGGRVQDLAEERERLAGGAGAEEMAINLMALDNELRPFLDAAGIAYDEALVRR